MNRGNQFEPKAPASLSNHRKMGGINMVQVNSDISERSNNSNNSNSPGTVTLSGTSQNINRRQQRSPLTRRSPTAVPRGSPGRIKIENTNLESEKSTATTTRRKSPAAGASRKSPPKKVVPMPAVDDYDDYDDQESEERDEKQEKKTRKSPRKTKRKVNKWAEMIGYITNSVAADVGYPIRAEEFMPIIRKNYPGNAPAKKKISKDTYSERARTKLQILKDVDPTLVDKANKSIAEIIQQLKKEPR